MAHAPHLGNLALVTPPLLACGLDQHCIAT